MATGALDHAGRNRHPIGERMVLVQEPCVVDEVPRGAFDWLGCVRGAFVALDHHPQALGDAASAAPVQQGQEPSLDPLFGFVGPFRMECEGGTPQIFEDMYQV